VGTVVARTRIELGRREDLGADCARCFGLCCVALAFARTADFPVDKPAGEPCVNLDADDGCVVHGRLREVGYKGCTVFDCFGAGQKVSQRTFGGRSWRDDPATREAMFAVFPVVRRLHELLWYLDEAITMVAAARDPAPWAASFERVRRLSDGEPAALAALDVDAEYAAARDLLVEASEVARSVRGGRPGRRGGRGGRESPGPRGPRGPRGGVRVSGVVVGPGSDLSGARLAGADLDGLTLRGSLAIAADLRGATLRRCDVLGVDLRDADLGGADLATAIYLTQMQVNSARGDDRTRLPDGFERPRHWVARTAPTTRS
jgi:hypothetical protein